MVHLGVWYVWATPFLPKVASDRTYLCYRELYQLRIFMGI